MFARILTVLIFIAVFVSALHQLINEDYWFHLRGGELVNLGQIPRLDTYSYPSAGREYLDPHWLFQWLLYRVHLLGGVNLAIVLKATLVTATFAILHRLARRDATSILSGLAVFAGALLASERFMVRPEIFTFLFLALTLWLSRRLEEGFRPALFLLPLLFVVWVNSEGLFILGLALLGAQAVSRPKEKALWLALGLSVLATMANPFFLRGALHPLVLFTRIDGSLDVYSSTIGEFLGPFDTTVRHPAAAFFPWFLGLLGIGLALCRRPRLGEILILAAFVFLSLKARRNIALLGIVAVPMMARWYTVGWRALEGRWGQFSSQGRRVVVSTAALVAVLGVVGYIHSVVTNRIYVEVETNRNFGLGEAENAFPTKAVEFLREKQIPGPIFSFLSSGSYMVWAHPDEPVFIDGRLEVHSTEHFSRSLEIRDGGPAWDAADHEFGFNVALIELGQAEALLQRMVRDPSWAMVYLDGKALVLLKKTPDNQNYIDEFVLTRGRMQTIAPPIADPESVELLPAESGWMKRTLGRRDIPWDQLSLGQFLSSMAAHDLAAEQYRAAAWAAPELASPRVLLAGALNQLRRPNEALRVILSAKPRARTATDQARVSVTLGDILLAGGEPARAIAAYDEFLSDPNAGANIGVVRVNRAQARLNSGDPAGAVEDCYLGLSEIPNYAEAYRILGLAEERLGRSAEALAAYQKFLQVGGQNPEVVEAIARLSGS